MYRYHEIIVKKESNKKKLMSERNDIVSEKYYDYYTDAFSEVNKRYTDDVKKDNRDKRMDVYRTVKLFINNDENLNKDEKKSLLEYTEYEATDYFNSAFIQYYIKLVKAFSAVSDKSNHELEVDEGENEDRFIIREFLNYNSCSIINMSKLEDEIQKLGDYGELLEKKVKEHKDVFGDKINYKNIFATSLTDNDTEFENDGEIYFTLEDGDVDCFGFVYEDSWNDENYINNPVNSDKEWRVCSTNMLLFPFISPDDSEEAAFTENPEIKKYADYFFYDESCSSIGSYDGNALESYYYVKNTKMKTSEIRKFAEVALDTYKSYYAANVNLLKKYNLNPDMAKGINDFNMRFYTDDFEVLYVYGNAETNELKYGYKKF